MNILSFDIEEWYIEKAFKGGAAWRYHEYDSMFHRILDLLERYEIKATFFCVGKLCEDFPYVVKEINERGHEIGCHSNSHQWINKMTPNEFREDTRCAVDALQQLLGKAIRSYRAPAFSIGQFNKWAFEILAEAGIENDASVFPGNRDFGGFIDFKGTDQPCEIIVNGCKIKEFPITLTTIPIIDKKVAYSGGGYFRILPQSFVKSTIRHRNYTMCYFHIADLVDFKTKFHSRNEYELYFKEPGTIKNRVSRYIKSNIGRKRAFKNLKDLISSFQFCCIEDASKTLNFPLIEL